MDRNVKVLVLVLIVPMVLYGVPYAYASVTSSSYVVQTGFFVTNNSFSGTKVLNCNSGDYATGAGSDEGTSNPGVILLTSIPTKDGISANTGDRPNGWQFEFLNTNTVASLFVGIFVVCQTPITVAGITVPEFGSLYAAVALAAVAYFGLSLLRSRSTKAAVPTHSN